MCCQRQALESSAAPRGTGAGCAHRRVSHVRTSLFFTSSLPLLSPRSVSFLKAGSLVHL